MNIVMRAIVIGSCFATLLIVGAGATRCPQAGDYLDTGQSQTLLIVEATAGGIQADLQGGGLTYCSNLATTMCMIACTVNFTTIHSPSYLINEHCYSAAEDGEDLKEIVVNATSNHPFYTILFHCDAISSYRCVFNNTLYTREVKVLPEATACSTPVPPTTSTPTVGSDGENATNGTNTTTQPPTSTPHNIQSVLPTGAIAGLVFGPALLVVLPISALILILYAVYSKCDCVRSRVLRSRRMHSWFDKCYKCGDNLERAISAEITCDRTAELVLQSRSLVAQPQNDIDVQREA